MPGGTVVDLVAEDEDSDLTDQERSIIHHAEANGPRKPQLWNVDDSGDKLALKDRYRF